MRQSRRQKIRSIHHKVIHVPIGTTQGMKMGRSGFGATPFKSPLAPFVKGGGPQDRGILPSDCIFIRGPRGHEAREMYSEIVFTSSFLCLFLRVHCTPMLDNFRSSRKFFDIGNISDSDIFLAKALRTPSSEARDTPVGLRLCRAVRSVVHLPRVSQAAQICSYSRRKITKKEICFLFR